MNQNLLDVLRRIINSKKVVLATIVLLVDVGAIWGFNIPAEQLTEGIGAAWNGFGALLVAAQGVIDAAQGSASDGSR